MIRWTRKIFFLVFIILFILCVGTYLLSLKKEPERITYGMSFNKIYADELGLPWKAVYTAMLDDLGVRYLRLAAHWNMVEPQEGMFNWNELDYQIEEAEKRGAHIVFAVGRRLPRWPECHISPWAAHMSWNEQKTHIRSYITAVVERYKDSPAIEYWQVENEPFLTVFADEHCGDTLDVEFLQEEITLVKTLDPSRQVIVTDSGNLGLWYPAWRAGDIFGTSIYMYLWNPDLGPIRTVYTPGLFRVKEKLVRLLFGNKPAYLIELSLEPWLLDSVPNVPIDEQLERMNMEKMDEILNFAKNTRFERQYLWGGEWWYWMREQGHGEFWDWGKPLFDK